METLLLTAHLASTLFMTGVIWFVQVVHYPLMGRVGIDRFVDYEREHQARTAWVVGPAMIVEVGTAVVLIGGWSSWRESGGFLVSFGLLVAIWISTFAWQVPLHNRLAKGFDPLVHRMLVRSNWIRTVAWTGRSGIFLGIVQHLVIF